MTAVNGAVLLLALTLAGVVFLTAAIHRETRRLPHHIEQALTPPEQPKHAEHVCMAYQCRDCRRPIHEHVADWDRILHLVTEWVCPECVLIAAYESDFAS